MKSLTNYPSDKVFEPEFKLTGSQQSNSIWYSIHNNYKLYIRNEFACQYELRSWTPPRGLHTLRSQPADSHRHEFNWTHLQTRSTLAAIQNMGRFLGDAINRNRTHLYELREAVKTQISNLKNSTMILQNYVRDETSQLKNIFEPAIATEIKKINELKS